VGDEFEPAAAAVWAFPVAALYLPGQPHRLSLPGWIVDHVLGWVPVGDGNDVDSTGWLLPFDGHQQTQQPGAGVECSNLGIGCDSSGEDHQVHVFVSAAHSSTPLVRSGAPASRRIQGSPT